MCTEFELIFTVFKQCICPFLENCLFLSPSPSSIVLCWSRFLLICSFMILYYSVRFWLRSVGRVINVTGFTVSPPIRDWGCAHIFSWRFRTEWSLGCRFWTTVQLHLPLQNSICIGKWREILGFLLTISSSLTLLEIRRHKSARLAPADRGCNSSSWVVSSSPTLGLEIT